MLTRPEEGCTGTALDSKFDDVTGRFDDVKRRIDDLLISWITSQKGLKIDYFIRRSYLIV